MDDKEVGLVRPLLSLHLGLKLPTPELGETTFHQRCFVKVTCMDQDTRDKGEVSVRADSPRIRMGLQPDDHSQT